MGLEDATYLLLLHELVGIYEITNNNSQIRHKN